MAFMSREIRQQPHVLARTLDSAVGPASRFKDILQRDKQRLKPRFVVIAARGSSDNAAHFGRYLIEIATGIPVSLAAPSVHTLYRARVDFRNALVVGVSQSGESTDINLVLDRAKRSGAITLAITNQPGSAITKLADHVFLVRAGREKSVAATKSYSGQLLLMYLLAYALGADLQMAKILAIPQLVEAALGLESQMAELAARYSYMRHAVVIGRGLNFGNAQEFALKLMETSYVVAERFSSADFLHGPIAMVEPRFPAFLFAPGGPVRTAIGQVIGRLRTIGAETIAITDRSNADITRSSTRSVVIPMAIEESLTPIPYIVPAQMFAASLALERGLDPDRPRALTKITRTL